MPRFVPLLLASACWLVPSSLVGEEPTVSALVKQLADTESEKVCAAAKALGQRGAKDALPALKELLKSRHGRIKWSAAEAVWRLEHKTADVVPVFAELLTATEPDVRAAAAWRLGRLDVDRQTVLLLASALRDEVHEVRVQAGLALANLGRHTEPALPALVRAFGDNRLDESQSEQKSWITATTSPALPALVELTDETLPVLLEALREKKNPPGTDLATEMRQQALTLRVIHVLPAFGNRTVEPLLHLLEAKELGTRAAAFASLREVAKVHGLPNAAGDQLEKHLTDADEDVRSMAGRVLAWVRPANAKAATALTHLRPDRVELLADLERMYPHNETARAVLVRLLGDDDKETSKSAYRLLGKLEDSPARLLDVWTKALPHADTEVRLRALEALGKLGPQAMPAKAALHDRYSKESDYYGKGGILDALTRIDPSDPALVRLLLVARSDKQPWVRMKAIDNLTALGSRATVAFAPLLAQLFDRPRQRDQDFDATDARRLIEALAATAPDAASRANVLLKALRQRDIRSGHELKNSWFMRDVLEDLLLANLPATTTGLRNALKDESVEVRQSAALVLARAGLDVARTVPILVEQCSNGQALDQEATRFHGRMVECLMRREHHSAELIAATWCNAWKSAPARVRSLLEPGLLVLQPEALPHLLEQLRQAKATQARRDLAHLLARFEGQSQVVLPILRAELGDAQLPAQYAAVQALRLLGADAAEAVPDLLRLLHHTHPGMRGLAVQALAGVGPAARPAVPALKALLKAKQLGLRLVAADALSQIDPSMSEALVVLREMFIELKRENSNLDVRLELPRGLSDRDVDHEAIEERLARYGERGIAVLAEILENVDLDEWSADNLSAQGGNPARVQAALLLARLGPEAKSAVPALRRALKDRDPFVREAAASALGRIGPAAREAAPDLLVLLEQEHRAGATGGAWSSTPRLGSPIDNSRSFDFRSLGRNARLERARNHHSGYYFDNVDPYHRIQAVHPHDAVSVLSRIDGEALSALPILRGIAKTSNHPGRLAAGLALWRSGDGADDLVAAFTDTLARHARLPQDDVTALPREVLDYLAEPDAPLKPAVRVMSEWLKRREESASDHDQAAVATALGRCGTAARAAEEVFRSMLKTRSWAVRRRVAVCLALYRITGDSKSAFPILREALLSAEERFTLYYRPERSDAPRVHAARALGVLADAGDETARRLLAETMKGDENLHVRLAALEATARHQDTTAAAERGLCALLRHPDAGVREATAMACGRLGARAKACLAALRTATQDGQLAVRQTARHALERLE